MVGQTLSQYRVLEKLGAGAMGDVYRAHDGKLRRDVALKVVAADAFLDADAQARLVEEARSASALNHPHICQVYEVSEAGGVSYIAMELVEGRPLAMTIPTGGLPVQTVLSYGAHVADALAHAHERGVLHRDLKSLNVVITPDGRAKVLDFGLAKRFGPATMDGATRTRLSVDEQGAVAGTLQYMAPETLRGETVDARADIWALGVVLHEMAAGRLPFSGRSSVEVTSAILRDPAPPLPEHVPASLRAVIERCLAKEPGQRYRSAAEVRAALEAIGSDARVTTAASQARPGARPSRLGVGIAGAAVVLALVGGVWAARGRTPLRSAPSTQPLPTAPRLSSGALASTVPEANEYYERYQLIAMSRLDLPEMRRILERALDIDPHFADARGEYGFTLALELIGGWSNDTAWLNRAEAEIRRALQDDPRSGRAHSALAAVYYTQGRMDLVEGEVVQALQANPNDVAASGWLQNTYMIKGDYERARDVARKALAISPNFFPVRMVNGEVLQNAGDLAGSISEREKVVEQAPANLIGIRFLARGYIVAGELAKARQLLERAAPGARTNFLIRLIWAQLLASEGKRGEALREMDESLHKYAEANLPFCESIAAIHATLDETDKALDWLDRAVRAGNEQAEWFQRNPLLANIQQQPRFKQIVESIAYRRGQRQTSSR